MGIVSVRRGLMRRSVRVIAAVKAAALTIVPTLAQPVDSASTHRTGGGISVVVRSNRHYTDSTIAEVAVHDRMGQSVHGLAWDSRRPDQADLSSFWRDTILQTLGVPGDYDSCSVVEHHVPRSTGFAVGFVLDHSPSMTTPRAIRMQRAVHAAIRRMAPADAVTVVKFTAAVRVEVPLMTDKPTALETFKINGINVRQDGTAIYDGILRALQEVDRAVNTQRRVLLVFTDGEDNASTVTLDSTINAALQRNTVIHVITYGMTEQRDISRLASETGGSVHALFDVYAIDSIFLDKYEGLRSGYTVRVWHGPQDDVEGRGAITTMETAHRRDLSVLDLVSMLPTIGVEILQGHSDVHTLAIAVAADTLQRSGSDELVNEGLTGLAWMMRRTPDVVVEILQPASTGMESIDPFERIRSLLIQAGVAPHRVIRGATADERLGNKAGGISTSVLMMLYRQ